MQARWAAARVRGIVRGNRFVGWLKGLITH
jgi:hypothetical protein